MTKSWYSEFFKWVLHDHRIDASRKSTILECWITPNWTNKLPHKYFYFNHYVKQMCCTLCKLLKATGADNIPAKVLKIAAPYICKVVTNVFNASYMSGQYPSIWKLAKVTPIYKGGSKTERNNQRPISVLPCISKIQESFANSVLQLFA